jgi:3-hydroxypropionyl-coenzyme A dehydratase
VLALDRDGPVALVTLDRPEKRNALSIELRFALAEALAELASDDSVRCAVLTGAGSAFCSGMDTTQFGGDAENRRRLVDSTAAAFGAVMSFPKPLLAAVNGPALAGGFAVALECDLRVAANSARFGFAELPRGIPPSYSAALAALPEPLARELCLTGRILDAEEARATGLVVELVADGEAVPRTLAIAAGVGSRPLATLVEVKRRFLLGAELARGALRADEERTFRAALLGEEPGPADQGGAGPQPPTPAGP